MNYMKALSIATYILGWYARASKDGQVSEEELLEGVLGAIKQLEL